MLPGLHKAALSLHPLRLLFLPKGGRMQSASVKWIGEQKFVATSPSGHAITLDSDRESNQAPGPMELLLMALGACTATDVVTILEKKRQKLDTRREDRKSTRLNSSHVASSYAVFCLKKK